MVPAFLVSLYETRSLRTLNDHISADAGLPTAGQKQRDSLRFNVALAQQFGQGARIPTFQARLAALSAFGGGFGHC